MSVQLPPTPADVELEDVVLLGMSIGMPVGSSPRLDQPCAYEHGSVGGWRQDELGEVTYTLLWRPLAYWDGAVDPAADPSVDADALQQPFVEQALASTRRDSRDLSVTDRRPLDIAGHRGELVDTVIAVRRKVGRATLHRRQALWTCAATGRHVAFEVSTLADDPDRTALFDQMAAGIGCHAGGTR